MPRWSRSLAVCAVLALAAACGGGTPAPDATSTPGPRGPITVPPGKALTIGLSAGLSGAEADLGLELAAAAEIAVGQFGGNVAGFTVQISRRDDGCSDPEKAADVARLLIADETLAGVIGPMCTTGAQAADRLYERAGVVHISPSATRGDLSEQGERFFFRTVWRDDAQAFVQTRYAIDELQAETVILVDDAEPYGNALADAFAERFADEGGTILGRKRVQSGTTDFSSLVREVIDSEAAVVAYEGLNPEGALLVKALRAAGYTGGFVGPDGLLNVRDFIATAESAAENAIITGGLTPSQEFLEPYVALYGRPPATAFVLQAHDAVTALLRAIETVAVTDSAGNLTIDREALAQALREQRFAGLTGSITFDERGDRSGETPEELGIAVYRVVNAAFVRVR